MLKYNLLDFNLKSTVLLGLEDGSEAVELRYQVLSDIEAGRDDTIAKGWGLDLWGISPWGSIES